MSLLSSIFGNSTKKALIKTFASELAGDKAEAEIRQQLKWSDETKARLKSLGISDVQIQNAEPIVNDAPVKGIVGWLVKKINKL